MFRWLRRSSALPQPSAAESVPTGDLAALLRVFLVDKVQAEIERDRAQTEVTLRLAQEKEKLRAARAEAARVRNRTLKRDAKGRLVKAQPACPLCRDPYYYPFTFEELKLHQSHSNGGQQ